MSENITKLGVYFNNLKEENMNGLKLTLSNESVNNDIN